MGTNQVSNKEGFPLPMIIPGVQCPVSLDLGNLYDNEAHYEKRDAQVTEHEVVRVSPVGCHKVVHLGDNAETCEE